MNTGLNKEPAIELRASARPTNLDSGMEELRGFAGKVTQMEEALAALSGVTGDRASRSVERLQARLADFMPSVTLLGQVKSGKTSLINALAGWADLLPSDVNPWTSVVTSLHLEPGTSRKETGARFQFMTEEEWDRLLTKGGRIGELADRAGADSELGKIRAQIETMREKSRKRLGRKYELLLGQEHEYGFFDKNLLERYICLGDDFEDDGGTASDQGRFADITRSADLFLNSPTVPIRMCLRDTPGVNDTFLMREQVTIRAIRDSRLCVLVLSAQQALTSVDMGLLRLVSNLKSRDVIIFVNRIDELSDPASQIPEIEASLRQTLRDHHGPDDSDIVFGSAYWANKVLSGGMEDMAAASSAALIKYAEASVTPDIAEMSPPNMVWALSGLPELFRHLSERIVTSLGEPHLAAVAGSAVTIASGQQAKSTIEVSGGERPESINTNDIRREYKEIAARHLESFEDELDDLIAHYRDRADRAHANFVERATHSLISHLSKLGEEEVWEYSPTGLRMLLRSAYQVFGTRLQSTAHKRFEAAVEDIAALFYKAFGPAVAGIQMSVPKSPDLPAPVSLGQTIALDFKDSWWLSWWRRTRGYQAFSKRFNKLIHAETEDFMVQLKSVQTALVREQFRAVLTDYLEEHEDILFDLATQPGGARDVQDLFIDRDEVERQEELQSTLDTLSQYAA